MATGILNHMMTAGQALKGMAATPMSGSTNGTGGTSGTSGTTLQYVSRNAGRTWKYDTSVGGF